MNRYPLLSALFVLGLSFPAFAQTTAPPPPAADDGPAPEDAPNVAARAPLPTGPYMKSCKDPILRDNILYATCLQPDKTQRQAKLALPCAGKIENKAGALVCAK